MPEMPATNEAAREGVRFGEHAEEPQDDPVDDDVCRGEDDDQMPEEAGYGYGV
jgi:hypothetical protein